MRRVLPPLALAAIALPLAAPATGAPVKGAPKCRLFPANNHWNLRVDKLPVLPYSDAMVRNIGADHTLHLDIGSTLSEGRLIGGP